MGVAVIAILTHVVSCSVTGAGKVTLIGSNCQAYRVGRRIDCEGGRVDRQTIAGVQYSQ